MTTVKNGTYLSRMQMVGVGLFFAFLAAVEFYNEFILRIPLAWPFGHLWWAPRVVLVGIWVVVSLIAFTAAVRGTVRVTRLGWWETLIGFSLIALLVMLFV